MNEYTNLSNNLPADAQKTIDNLGKLFKDYTTTYASILLSFLGLEQDFLYADGSFKITERSEAIESPPPRIG